MSDPDIAAVQGWLALDPRADTDSGAWDYWNEAVVALARLEARLEAAEKALEPFARGIISADDFDVTGEAFIALALAPDLARLLADTAEGLEWALDVLEIALKRIDTIDDALSSEHHAIRSAGITKARDALARVAALNPEGGEE